MSEVPAAADAFDPVDFLERAVSIPSDESVDTVRDLVRSTLETNGVDVTVDDAGNLLAGRGPNGASPQAGDTAGPHLVLNTHMDTVAPHFDPEWSDDGERLSGRGACDAKGPLAAMLAAFLAADAGRGRLSLALTPDEEVYSTGAHALVTGNGLSTDDAAGNGASPIRTADAVIVGEPTGLDVCTAAPGRFEGTIELAGERAHAAEPETGANAVDALAEVLTAIRTFDERSDVPDVSSQLGDPTLTPTVVAGGETTNQVPAEARLTVDRRPAPPETPASFEAALLEHLRDAVSPSIAISFSFTERPTPFFESWATDPSESIVGILADASGGAVRPFGAATEASYFAPRAPTVVFGPGRLADDEGPIAHADREYVRVDAVRSAADALTRTAESVLLADA
ncbi:M20/M25/M40 family metallo-hydrolase [Halovivax limisalsi]|uniref:M20/M25/M40 family metallo-hydrolase n=1 Tax=Halovivax limisalsi TaxID=1453760 RepID=UPI001FFD39D7|nr:M20/M25/M40 family metallo-hydrolase [Halovivax limisalsi]